MRKRRSNSDSEITLLDSLQRQIERKAINYDCDMGIMSQNITDGLNIDILNDSSLDHTLLNSDSAMDPSQMFVASNNYQDALFSCNLPINPLETSPTNEEPPIVEEPPPPPLPPLPPITTLTLSPQEHQSTLVPTQLIFIDTSLTNCTQTVFITSPSNTVLEPHVNKLKPIRKKKVCSIAPQTNVKIEKVEEDLKINKQWINDTTDLKNKGCKFKSGLWSSDEENLLRSNIDYYCKKMSIADPIKMIYFTPKEDRKEFYRSVSTGINRPLFTIYRKILRMYDSKNYVGKYSPDEVEKLEKLNQICPNDWKSIGLVLGRSASSVKDRARLIKPQNNRGKWNEDELNALSKAIREVTNTKMGESVTEGINWVQVAQKIITRTSKQCRKKWLTYLNWKESGGKDWVKHDEVELINRIVQLNVKEESKINWNKVANGWESARSPQWLREKWWQIKKTLPNYQQISFPDLLEQLQNVYVPQLLEKLQDFETSLSDSKDLTQNEEEEVNNEKPEMANLTESFERNIPLTEYELQLLMNSGDVDLINGQITTAENSVDDYTKNIDGVDSLQAETSLPSISTEESIDFNVSEMNRVNSCDLQSSLNKTSNIDFHETIAKIKAEFVGALKSKDITFDCDDIKALDNEPLLDVAEYHEEPNTTTSVSLSDVVM